MSYSFHLIHRSKPWNNDHLGFGRRFCLYKTSRSEASDVAQFRPLPVVTLIAVSIPSHSFVGVPYLLRILFVALLVFCRHMFVVLWGSLLIGFKFKLTSAVSIWDTRCNNYVNMAVLLFYRYSTFSQHIHNMQTYIKYNILWL